MFILLEGPGNAFFVSSFSSGVYRSCQIEKSAKKPQFWTAEVRLSAWKKSRNLKNNSKCQHTKSYELWLRVDLLGLRTTQYTLFSYNNHNNAKRFGDENEENISTMRCRSILLRVEALAFFKASLCYQFFLFSKTYRMNNFENVINCCLAVG